MSKLRILDCTLRDGGYINHWKFGSRVIQGIVKKLEEAQIDIIECGFLRDIVYDKDASVYSEVSQIEELLPHEGSNAMYVAMIALGDIPIEKIGNCDGSAIDGIRLTFHKHEWQEAKMAVKALMDKGYQVFVQPVGTTSYTDEELLALIRDVNDLHPFAFYLVDTLGVLYPKEMCRLFSFVADRLDAEIAIGFHSHNNLQLSFSNAQSLIDLCPHRDLIIDASVYGMGRGVGNLATELIAEYINQNVDFRYAIIPLLSIADKYIMPIYAQQRWGYDLPYFLSATVSCHPNYASYLLGKLTLRVEDIHHILQAIPEEKRELFDAALAEELYHDYQKCFTDDAESIRILKDKMADKEVLMLAPGGLMEANAAAIAAYIRERSPIVISVNYIPAGFEVDAVFFSNSKRFDLAPRQFDTCQNVIVTSNVPVEENMQNVYRINYSDYIGEGPASDNAGAMLIRFLKKCQVKKITLAGFDGFSETSQQNFSVEAYRTPISSEEAAQRNSDISYRLSHELKDVDFDFITPTRYQV